jgi:hypothetical protein
MPIAHTQRQIKAKANIWQRFGLDTNIAFQFYNKSGISVNFVFVFYRLNSTFLAIFTALFKTQHNLLDSEGFF